MSFWKRLFGRAQAELTETVTEGLPLTRKVPAEQNPKFPITLKAADYGDEPPKTWVPLLAKGWTLKGSFTMWEIAEFIRKEKANYPNDTLFGILDDPSQAFYTSGHTMGMNGLEDIDPKAHEGLHPNSLHDIEDGEFVYLSHPSEFPIRHKVFMDYVEKAGPTDWHNAMMWTDGDSGAPVLLGSRMKHPPTQHWDWVRETLSYVLRVPVAQACEAIAVMPNGYFDDDMQPDENYQLARALEETFNLQIIGMGATYAGYMREAAFTAEEAQAFGEFLAPLYSSEPADVAARIAKIAEGEDTIFLAYGNRGE